MKNLITKKLFILIRHFQLEPAKAFICKITIEYIGFQNFTDLFFFSFFFFFYYFYYFKNFEILLYILRVSLPLPLIFFDFVTFFFIFLRLFFPSPLSFLFHSFPLSGSNQFVRNFIYCQVLISMFRFLEGKRESITVPGQGRKRWKIN